MLVNVQKGQINVLSIASCSLSTEGVAAVLYSVYQVNLSLLGYYFFLAFIMELYYTHVSAQAISILIECTDGMITRQYIRNHNIKNGLIV